MNDWIAAGIAMAAGLVVGTGAGRFVQATLSKPSRPKSLRSAAGPLASLVFSALLVAGLMTALGFVNKTALEDIPNDLVAYLPKVLSGAIVLILANVAAQLSAAALEGTVARLGNAARNVPNMVRWTILAFGVILASAQLGIDTTIINITVAAILFGIALAIALMIGIGSRRVTAEVAAGRAVRRLVRPGDRIQLHDVAGTVVLVGSVSVEVDCGDGTTASIPNSRLVSETIKLERRAPAEPLDPTAPAAG